MTAGITYEQAMEVAKAHGLSDADIARCRRLAALSEAEFEAELQQKPRRTRGKSAKSLRQIETSIEILAEIQPAGVRAVCYQLFVRGLLQDMGKSRTGGISKLLVYAREHGLIPWAWIVDETREAERVPSWDDPERFALVVQRSYRRDRWAQQPRRLEVWSEKGTVRGTLAPVLDQYGVTFRVMHGFGSATVIRQMVDETCDSENPLLVLYVGDWDPSGLCMSEADLPKRLAEYGAHVEIQRVALNEEDVTNGGLPWFDVSTKAKDPRYRWFVQKHGRRCWELDALNPVVLRERVAERIRGVIDMEYWARCEIIERAERESLVEVMGTWKSLLSSVGP